MWCAQTVTDSAAIEIVVDQRLVAEDRLAAEDREDLGHDAEERQRDDVHLRVAEEPEEVLPQDGASVGRVEHLGVEDPVEAEPEQGGGEDGEGHDHEDRGDQRVPGEDRHAPHRHAGGAHGDDGGDEVHRAEDGAEARHAEPEDPQVSAQPW
jgi:hypothetical protein